MVPGLALTGRVELSGQKLARADVREWLARAAVWFETVGDAVLDARLDRDGDRTVLSVTFHPAAEDVVVRLSSSGTVRLTANTWPAGPGYHAYLCGTLDAFAEDFGIVWDQVEDPTGFSRTADPAALQTHFLTFLRRACDTLATSGDEPLVLGLPADHGFTHPGPVLTPLGPRPREWLAAARDFFPWWTAEPDAAFYRDRALTLLWCEFPWRPPLTEDEGELTDQIAADLEMAHSLDPTGPLPWAEWAEVLAAVAGDRLGLTMQGIEPELKAEVLRRAAVLDPATRTGYRRYPVRVEVGGGWSVEIPGSFADGWDADGRTWVGWDDHRRVTARVGGGAESFAPEFAEALDETGRRVWRLTGLARANGCEALAYRIDVPDLADRAWAETVWRSLRHAASPVNSSVA
ncbi:MAG TPA: hypothetical protein VM533_15840 [Fimbriiglobus sp.]|nr:hypothetical protein [Fimbriiglobus sp.]